MNISAISRSGMFVLLVICLAGCSEQPGQAKCSFGEESLVIDPEFATFSAPYRERKWHVSEHRSQRSFKYGVADSVLSIERVGAEPWAMVTQSTDAKALAGKKVQFSAELKLNLFEPDTGPRIEAGGGLLLSARRNGKALLHSTMDHEPHIGVSDWVVVNVVETLPTSADSLQIGFIHQAAGTIEIRNPSLRVMDSSEAECAGLN